MAESPAVENLSGNPDIHPILRQRMLNRAATVSDGARHSSPLPRRQSSVYSDTRHSFRSSTDSLHRPNASNDEERLTKNDEPSFWHSAPLAFAIVPAFAGLIFQNGGAVVTDILLLGFGSMFLNWCLRSPWEWYHAAQQVHYIEPGEDLPSDTLVEEDEESDDSGGPIKASQQDDASQSSDQIKGTRNSGVTSNNPLHELARQELQTNEIMALIACFFGPLVGAYGLHTIRSQLTRPAEGLVSNFNLTIFVMAAELRPVSHLIKLKQARMLHLQRVVRADREGDFRKADIRDLCGRLNDLESQIALSQESGAETAKMGATVRQSLQPQLDALNRAVRRYEKRQVAQSMQSEARFQELDSRLKDALALAAAAARSGQQPGIISMGFTWSVNLVTSVLQTSWAIATSPFNMASAVFIQAKTWIFGDRQPRKRLKAATGGSSSSVPISRVQSRIGR
ncbi:hypothetical protein DM02DRAFT_283618 [Periconia macrospinosa]|uniref:Uncharacterized protein n=1 Tax=Periconia macrospinosa TaxID=97972 RepID=A0A2V1EBY5_9PLEO|nr:hypothetical protein DM02DRAFT_283618 [Periconia macrospinosa]